MTFGATLGVLVALGAVLGLMMVALRVLKHFMPRAGGGAGKVPLEVMQRVSLGPKHAIAVVRVGEKVLAVSIGEGGIRPLMELADADREQVLAAAASSAPVPFQSSAQAALGFARRMPAVAGLPGTDWLVKLASRQQAATGATVPATTPVTSPEPTMWERATAAAELAAWGPPPDHNMASRVDAGVTGIAQAVAEPRRRETPRDFRAVLGMALSSSTRLASIGLVALSALSIEARAQVAPPVRDTLPQITLPAVTPPAIPQVAPVVAAPTAAAAAVPQVDSAAARVAAPVRPNARRAPAPSLAQRRAQAARSAAAAQAARSAAPAAQQPAAQPASMAVPSGTVDTMIARLAPQMDLRMGDQQGGLRLSGTVGVVVMMGLLTLLPTLVLMMTGFTRILIVLHFLKQALGTQSAPPAHLVGGLALLLTGFVMGPTLAEVNRTALQPWMSGQIQQAEMMSTGVKPFREFMLKQTRERDIEVFVEMSRMEAPATVEDVPLVVLVSAFVTSELRTAFQIGFALFLPFIIIDVVVSSVLMSMGMFMLPPAMIALPFKLLLFVLVDGWTLVVQSLVQSFK